MLIMDILSYENIIGAILQVIDTICINISAAIYNVIGFLYQIFMALASAQIFSSDQYQNISNNLYAVIGVVALFLISYALLRAIINPDGGGKSELAVNKIIPNILKAIALIAFVPAIFNLAYNVQNVIIASNVIPRIILGNDDYSGKGETSSGIKFNYKKVGKQTANIMFKAFLYPADGVSESEIEVSDCYATKKSCPEELLNHESYSFKDASSDVEDTDNSVDFSVYSNFARKIHGDDKQLEYNGIFQIIAGIFAVYIFFNYCIDLGVRAVKLGYYQVIAPLPILTLIIPGQSKVFQTWMKSTLSTFAEVFIKIAILFFGLLLIQNMPDFANLWENSIFGTPDTAVINFAKVFLIIGVLIFIKQAPKLVTDLFGISSGSFKLGIKDKFNDALSGLESVPVAGNIASRGIGAATGALGAGWSSKMNGGTFASGMKYGAVNGAKDKGFQFKNMREAAYSNLGFKGKPGIFGGQNWLDKKADDVKNEYSDYYKDKVLPNWIRDQEDPDKNPVWAGIYNSKVQEQEDKKKAQLAQLRRDRDAAEAKFYSPEEVAARRQKFADNIASERNNVYEQLANERTKFESDRRTKMDSLRSRVGLDSSATDEFNRLRTSRFEDSAAYASLNSKLNSLNTAQFKDIEFNSAEFDKQKADIEKSFDELVDVDYYDGDKKQIVKKQMSKLEADAIKATRKEYRDLDVTYDNRYDVYSSRMREAKNKEFKNSEIGQQMQIFSQNLANLQGGGKTAAKSSEPKSNSGEKKS